VAIWARRISAVESSFFDAWSCLSRETRSLVDVSSCRAVVQTVKRIDPLSGPVRLRCNFYNRIVRLRFEPLKVLSGGRQQPEDGPRRVQTTWVRRRPAQRILRAKAVIRVMAIPHHVPVSQDYHLG